MCVCVCVCVCACVCVCVHVYVCVCVCACVLHVYMCRQSRYVSNSYQPSTYYLACTEGQDSYWYTEEITDRAGLLNSVNLQNC